MCCAPDLSDLCFQARVSGGRLQLHGLRFHLVHPSPAGPGRPLCKAVSAEVQSTALSETKLTFVVDQVVDSSSWHLAHPSRAYVLLLTDIERCAS